MRRLGWVALGAWMLGSCAINDTVVEGARCSPGEANACGEGALICDPLTSRCVFPEHRVDGGSTGGGTGGSTGGGTGGGVDAGPGCSGPRIQSFSTGDGGYPLTATTGDFNSDGFPDLIVANYYGNSVSLFMAAPTTGAFSLTKSFPCSMPRAVFAADMNGDGLKDLIALCTSTIANGTTEVFLNNAGVLATLPSTVVTWPVSDVTAMALGNLNGDSTPDFVAVTWSGNSLTTLSNGAAGYGTPTSAPVASWQAVSVLLKDVDGDGCLDGVVAIGASQFRRLATLPGNCGGGFGASRFSVLDCAPGDVRLADLDRNGTIDAVANCNENNAGSTVSVALGDGTGLFTKSSRPVVGTLSWAVETGDFNGDGIPDVVSGLACNGGVYTPVACPPGLSFLAGGADGGFAPASNPAGGGIDARWLHAADLNRDGQLDLVVVNSGTDTVTTITSSGATCPIFR